MKVLVTGGKDFDDYSVFRRAMGVVMSDLHDDELLLMLTGPYKTNELARQFVNLTESSFRARNKKLLYTGVPPSQVPWQDVDVVVSLVRPPQKNTVLGYEAEKRGLDVHVFRF
jgi:hypothetical protein